MTYEEYLESPEWKGRADAAKYRDGHRCRLCNSGERLEAHHRTYENLGNERLDDLTTLCRFCHGLYSAAVKVMGPPRGEMYQPAPHTEVAERRHTPEEQAHLDAIQEATDNGDKDERTRLVMEYVGWQQEEK